MRPCKLHVAGSKPAASTSQRGVMVTCLVANEALRVRFTASAPPAFVAQLAEHRALDAEVAGSYPVDSLQSAMPQRSGARLRIECNSQAGSTPVVDNLRVGTVDVMPIRNRLPLSGCRFDPCCSRTSSLVVQWLSTPSLHDVR